MKKRKIVKWLIGISGLLAIAVLAALVALPRLNHYQKDGRIAIPGLTASVEVLRDENGMPYIYAANEDDLLRAQGFIAAQDRLFQMQLTRMMAAGRISELVGEKGKMTDLRNRTIGFLRNARRHENLLDQRTRRFFQLYLDGVNAFINNRSDIPLEFKLSGIKPEPWSISDSLAILYYMGWNSAANLKTEILAQMLIEKLGTEKAQDLFPLNINPDDGPDRPKTPSTQRSAPQGRLNLPLGTDRTLMAHMETTGGRLLVGSNNWVVGPALSPGGKPILANDPHLDARILPGPWYPSGLITPAFRAVGVIIPGVPGMLIGRTDRIAMGVTNAYGDAQDLYVETINPQDPSQYLEGEDAIPFQVIEETMRIKDNGAPSGFREEKVTIRLTKRGPVISGLLPGLKTDKVITVRWSPFESMEPSLGLERFLSARSVTDLREALRSTTSVMLNFVIADGNGQFGWQTSGRLPIRSRGDGTIPFPVIDGQDNWSGWIPYDQMPHLYNPKRGWVGTCNHKTVSRDYPYYYSSYFSASYRYRRLMQLLDKAGKKSVDDHWTFQRDTLNLMARELVPTISKALMEDKETEALGKILNQWDAQDAADQAAPAIFQALYRHLAWLVFHDLLGEDLARLMLDEPYFWQERFGQMIRKGHLPGTGSPKTPSLPLLIRQAARNTVQELSAQYGPDPSGWVWGKIHRMEFVSPLRREGFGKDLLGGGSHPMGGSQETLYRASFDLNRPYTVTFSASLRMVIDFSDADKVIAVLPGGVSGRLLDPHHKDQISPFMGGEKRFWWFSDTQIRNHATSILLLCPQ